MSWSSEEVGPGQGRSIERQADGGLDIEEDTKEPAKTTSGTSGSS